MELKTLTIIVVVASFAVYIGIALWSKASSTGEFYVAGKGVNPIANGMATAADWMSAASFISLAGIIAFGGANTSVYMMGWTGGYVLLALLLAPYLRKFGKFTVPEFIGDRYYSKAARVVAVLCLIIISFTYVAGQMRGVGIVFSRFLEVEILTGLIIGMGIVFFYAVLGGMKGITYTQVAQYCVLIFAYMVPAIFISIQFTGNPVPQLAFGSKMVGSDMYLLEKLDSVLMALGFNAYTETTKSPIDMMFITAALMVGTAGLPHVIVRFFTVPKVSDARRSAFWALLFILILFTTAPAVGVLSRLNLIKTVQPTGTIGMVEGNLNYEQRPQWFKTWEKTGLLGFEDKNGDGRVQYYNDKNPSYKATADSYGWKGSELKVDRDIMVLANPEIAKLPNWVIALVAAGGIAAALSTAAGLLLVISSAISHDLIKGIAMPQISEKRELLVGRIAAIVAILIAGYLGANPPGFVAQVVALAFGLAASSLFPAILMGIFSKKANNTGAIAGMIVGMTFTLSYIIYFKFVHTELNNPEHWWFGISPEGIGTMGMIFNFLTIFVVSKLTAPPPQEVQDLVESIRIPKAS